MNELYQAARREVARARITLAVQLGLLDYAEHLEDRRLLDQDSRHQARADRNALLALAPHLRRKNGK